MYKIYDVETEELIAQVISPRFVKVNPDSGAWIQCDAWQAECIALDGKRYSIEGRELVKDAPTVVKIKFVDDAQESLRHSNDLNLFGWTLQKFAEEIVAAKSDNEKLAYALRKISEELESE